MPSIVPTHALAGPEPGQQEHGDRAEGGDADLGDVEQVRPAPNQ